MKFVERKKCEPSSHKASRHPRGIFDFGSPAALSRKMCNQSDRSSFIKTKSRAFILIDCITVERIYYTVYHTSSCVESRVQVFSMGRSRESRGEVSRKAWDLPRVHISFFFSPFPFMCERAWESSYLVKQRIGRSDMLRRPYFLFI